MLPPSLCERRAQLWEVRFRVKILVNLVQRSKVYLPLCASIQLSYIALFVRAAKLKHNICASAAASPSVCQLASRGPTANCHSFISLQGYLAHDNHHPRRTTLKPTPAGLWRSYGAECFLCARFPCICGSRARHPLNNATLDPPPTKVSSIPLSVRRENLN